jgi:hypothetical protein
VIALSSLNFMAHIGALVEGSCIGAIPGKTLRGYCRVGNLLVTRGRGSPNMIVYSR